jgi:acetate kinase
VRRYGFHGLSYDYISGHLAETAPELHAGRVIVAHLGNGSSMCGIRAGRSVASSMGFTALDGLPMGTRCGQIDPGVLLYMIEQEGMGPAELGEMLYRRSGLLGLSGVSSDMRSLLASEVPAAREAIDYFTARIRRETGGLTAALEGLDALVFTGGIGENATEIRAEICAGLGWLGVRIDPAANDAGARVISAEGAQVTVMVIPTNEELVIARAAARA